MTLTECYARCGATVKAPRQAWSAMSDDGTVAILTLWSDFFRDVDRREYFGPPPREPHQKKKRIEHLRHAQDHCVGIFKSIIITRNASNTGIKTCEVGHDYRLVDLNEETAEFHAVRAED
jgi:hypothetical protein